MAVHAIRVICTGLLFAACVSEPALAAQGIARPTLAIVDFEIDPAGTVIPPPHLGTTLGQLLLDRLVACEQYRVLDGRWLASHRLDGTRSDTLGDLIARAGTAHVDYVVIGSVTRFSTEERRRSAGGAALRLPLLGGVGRRRTELAMSLLVRVVDVRTGEVVTTATAMARAEHKQRTFGALGLVGGLPAGALVTTAASGVRDRLLDASMQRAIAQTADALVTAAPRLTRRLDGSIEK